MHIIKLCPGDWVKKMVKINQAVGEKNCLDTLVGRKRKCFPFRMNKFCKYIRCVKSAVIFGVKDTRFVKNLKHM